ncbi:hypothetical protein Trydic_g4775 [Trypoxylus dichotomus]
MKTTENFFCNECSMFKKRPCIERKRQKVHCMKRSKHEDQKFLRLTRTITSNPAGGLRETNFRSILSKFSAIIRNSSKHRALFDRFGREKHGKNRENQWRNHISRATGSRLAEAETSASFPNTMGQAEASCKQATNAQRASRIPPPTG